MLLVAGKMLKEACSAHAVPAPFTCHCFSATFLSRIWSGLAQELKLEGMSGLFSYF